MCYLCDESHDGSQESCQNCGRLICFDMKGEGDDVCAPAAVSASGDLYCLRCARREDEREEAEDELDEFWDEDDMPAVPWDDD